MSQQRTVSVPPALDPETEEGLTGSEEGRETRAFFFQYLSRRAGNDNDLRETDAQIIHQEREQAVQAVAGSSDAAAEVASRLADLGDEIDFQYQSEMQEIIELTGSPESAFHMFSDVVKNLFEWDQQGGAKINLGRIAALMAYCYHLCKTYISQRVASSSLLISFVGLVAGWLFKFLIQAKFYEWLRNQGGWGQLLMAATSGITSWPWGKHTLLVVGLASIAVWAWSFFRSSS